jgi:hypothetical protein
LIAAEISGGATQAKVEKFGARRLPRPAGTAAELGSTYVQLAMADASFATGQAMAPLDEAGSPDGVGA